MKDTGKEGMKEAVSLEIRDHLAWVTINREEQRNALDFDVLQGLCDAFLRLQQFCEGEQAYKEVRCVVLGGAGDKAFVAGADIKVMQQSDRVRLHRFIRLGQRLMREIERTPLPVIAVVQGFALGGGLELALACDFIIAGTSAKLGQPEVNLGLIPGFGGTQRLCARAGVATAKRLVMTGQMVTAEEAKALGVIDWCVPPEELANKTAEVVRLLLTKAPLALAAAKRAIENFYMQTKLAGLEQEVEEFLGIFSTQDAGVGISAFLEKGTPEFTGR